MAFPVVESFAQNTGTTTTSPVANKPTGVVSGDLLLMYIAMDSNAAQWGSGHSGWTLEGESNGNSCSQGLFSRISDGGEGSTETLTAATSADYCAFYIRISGHHATTFMDVKGTFLATNGSSIAIASVNTTVDECLCFYGLSFDGGDGFAFSVSGTGWTESDEAQVSTATDVSSGCWGTRELASSGATGDATVSCQVGDGANVVQFAIAPGADATNPKGVFNNPFAGPFGGPI